MIEKLRNAFHDLKEAVAYDLGWGERYPDKDEFVDTLVDLSDTMTLPDDVRAYMKSLSISELSKVAGSIH